MAIKGKGRTRARQPVRAPRRGPVPVPLPLARRRGVQLLATFIAGLLVFLGGVWLTNGLRAERAADTDRSQELTRRQAGAAWNQEVTTEVGKLGDVQPGRPPVILPEVRSTLQGLKDGPPKDAVEVLQDAADRAKTASDAIGAFDLTGAIRNKGFDEAGVLRFLTARDELVSAIDLYREAALLGVVAADLDGHDRAAVLERADSVLAKADTQISRYYLDQTEALAAAGIAQQPTLPGS
jgi:hypothetical protein